MKVDLYAFAAEELDDDAEDGEDDDDRHQDQEVADPFAEHVKRTGHGRGRHDLTDACFAVAGDGAFDDVKAEPADKERGDDRHHRADPGGVELAAIFAKQQADVADGGLIAEEHCQPEHDEKAVAAHALKKVGAGEVIDDARGFHCLPPMK